MGFFRQESWGALPFSTPGNFPNPGIEHMSPASPALAGGFFTTEPYKDSHTATLLISWLCFFSRVGSPVSWSPAVASFHATYLTIPGKNVSFSITPTKRVHGIGLHHTFIYETCCVTQIDQDCIMGANLEPESRDNLNLTIRTKG